MTPYQTPEIKLYKHRVPYSAMPDPDIDGDGKADHVGIHATACSLRHVDADGHVEGEVQYAVEQDNLQMSHEAAHMLRNEDNAQMHHEWWRFCTLVGHKLRLRRRCGRADCVTVREIAAGDLLMKTPDNVKVPV